ncbi:MAG TPA: hypothetical protein VFO80_00505 [Sphingomonas sp.]|nr:hypothetical protein [Sphingomonas sp.]
MILDFEREHVAYSIIIAVLAIAIPAAVVMMRRRKREKLRRRGIKTHGH